MHIAYTGLLQGSGETMTSLRINSWTTFLVQIPLSYLLGFPMGLGALGIWLSIPLAFIVKAFLDYSAYRGNRWAREGAYV